jgi:hypothetical protein
MEGFFEYDNETSGSIKCWEILERLAAPQQELNSMEFLS